jgi:hypothetical protein
MTNYVFVAGHGRVVPTGDPLKVPQGVTLNWAVKERFNSTKGLSTALLRKDFDLWEETKSAGQPYREHYLCPDISFIMSEKGKAFNLGQWNPSSNYWLLQPKSSFATSLSAILKYLQTKLPGSLEVYWTCCRSPINERSQGKVEFERGKYLNSSIAEERPGNIAKAPTADAKITEVMDGNVCITGIEGAVTLKNKTDGGLALDATWPGGKGFG